MHALGLAVDLTALLIDWRLKQKLSTEWREEVLMI